MFLDLGLVWNLKNGYCLGFGFLELGLCHINRKNYLSLFNFAITSLSYGSIV
jgi:hypothetical protein